jgi:hypothetical protein
MCSASALDLALASTVLFPEVQDVGSVRKRIYPKVKQDLKALINAKREQIAAAQPGSTPP